MNASDGSDVQRVSFPSDKELDVEPHFSPDGTRVAFTRIRNCYLRYKENGRFPRPKGCISAIHVATIGGTGLTRITQWGQDTGGIDWSPDGTKVVYNTGQDRNSSYVDIFVANADGSHPVNLTNNRACVAKCPAQFSGQLSWRAKWSPDSTKFVFDQADCNHGPSLWVMNADGSGQAPAAADPFSGQVGLGRKSPRVRRWIEIDQSMRRRFMVPS